jgi:hypothetical protein
MDVPVETLSLFLKLASLMQDSIVWLKHFAQHTKLTEDDPVLLILNKCASHCSLPAVLF